MNDDEINDGTDDFDRWLARPAIERRTTLVDAAVEVRETLEGMWLAAKSVFGTDARPEHAISLLPVALARRDEERRQRAAEYDARREDGPAPT